MSKQKFLIMGTFGPEDAERATIPFVMATAAQAADIEVTIGLQASAVLLAGTGGVAAVAAANFPPLAQLLPIFLEAGGKLLVCAPCLMARGMDPKAGLIPEATVVGAAVFVAECAEASKVLVY
ncbi:MAG: DsrE family protein [Magnetospirillum sp.]|nr:DsrE family protein [Magnetospirillum sp.]